MSGKKSLLVTCKILGLFVNIMTADDKCSLLYRDKLMQPIQIQLTFSQFFFFFFFYFHFLNFDKILKKFKKYEPHSLCIDEITDFERSG